MPYSSPVSYKFENSTFRRICGLKRAVFANGEQEKENIIQTLS